MAQPNEAPSAGLIGSGLNILVGGTSGLKGLASDVKDIAGLFEKKKKKKKNDNKPKLDPDKIDRMYDEALGQAATSKKITIVLGVILVVAVIVIIYTNFNR